MTLIRLHIAVSAIRIIQRISFFISISILIQWNGNASGFWTCPDTDKPIVSIEIGNCEPAIYNKQHNYCQGHITIHATAVDDQTPDSLLMYSYAIDLFKDGHGSLNGFDCKVGPLSRQQMQQGIEPLIQMNEYADNPKNPFSAAGIYPIGIHKICWYVTDSCGNTGALCQLFEIKDCEAPVINCIGGTQIYTMNLSRSVTLHAFDFVESAIDNCSSSKSIQYFINNIQDSILEVNCDDFLKAGAGQELSIPLQIIAMDEEGNISACPTTAIIQDPNQLCFDLPSRSVISLNLIANKIDIGNEILPNIGVSLFLNNHIEKKYTTTNKYNSFIFGDLYNGKYTISASKNDDPYNSISTLDLIAIHKHLLNLNPFLEPLQFIAADVNDDGICTSNDMNEIMRVLLRDSNHYNLTDNWKIGKVITDSSGTHLNQKPEFNIDRKLSLDLDLRVIKMGDVNDFVFPPNSHSISNNANDSLVLSYSNQIFHRGDVIHLPFYSENFDSIIGIQGTIEWDSTKLQFRNITKAALIIDAQNTGGPKSQGKLTFSWHDVYPRTYSSNAELFSLEFTALQDGDLCDALQLNSLLTPSEAYKENWLIKNFKIVSCDAITSNQQLNNTIHADIYPNPTKDYVQIQIDPSTLFPINLSLINAYGNLLYQEDLQIHSKTLNTIDLPSGLYFIKLNKEKRSRVYKFMKLN